MFAAPPTELAVHPTDGEAEHELFLMCDDVHATTEKLAESGVETTMPTTDRDWGSSRNRDFPAATRSGSTNPSARPRFER